MYKWKFFQDCYMNRKHRGSLSSSSRESVKQTSLSAKKKTLFIQKSPPASISTLHLLILKRKNSSYFRAFSTEKNQSSLSRIKVNGILKCYESVAWIFAEIIVVIGKRIREKGCA